MSAVPGLMLTFIKLIPMTIVAGALLGMVTIRAAARVRMISQLIDRQNTILKTKNHV